MDVRLLILAGTFLLLVGSLAVLFWALGRSARDRRMQGSAPMLVEGHSGASGPVDTDLRGLVLEVSADAPSASLLTPLRTGEWAPPAHPAPADELAGVSLSERIESFTPFPDIHEPAFAVDTYPAWEVEPGAVQAAAVTEPASTGELPDPPASSLWVPNVTEDAPSVGLPPSTSSDSPVVAPIIIPPLSPQEASAAESHTDWDDDFEAEIARLLPDGPPAVGILTSQPEPEPEPDLEPEPQPEPEPEPLPQRQPEPALPQPGPEPLADAVPGGFDFWEGQLREQQSMAVAAVKEAATQRPAARVSDAVFVPPMAPVTIPAPPPRPSRPVARVHAPDGEVTEYAPAADARQVRQSADGRDAAPDLVMVAPVEMWFGDSRIGVKAGTATYERFRKYADVLFADLGQAGDRPS